MEVEWQNVSIPCQAPFIIHIHSYLSYFIHLYCAFLFVHSYLFYKYIICTILLCTAGVSQLRRCKLCIRLHRAFPTILGKFNFLMKWHTFQLKVFKQGSASLEAVLRSFLVDAHLASFVCLLWCEPLGMARADDNSCVDCVQCGDLGVNAHSSRQAC